METIKIYRDKSDSTMFDNETLGRIKELYTELGLTGQLAEQGKSPIPYEPLNSRMALVFNTLCPTETTIESFNFGVIPLEVLEEIALCKKEGYFQKLYIQYDDEVKDPIIIGETGFHYAYDEHYNRRDGEFATEQEAKNAYPNNGTRFCFSTKTKYIVARWGAEDKSFAELTVEAKKRYTESQTTMLQSTINNYKSQLDNLPNDIIRLFGAN
jgi:hypothetical protein